MMRDHPSIPFLTAAGTALILYRVMSSALQFSDLVVFTIGLVGAGLLSAVCLVAHLVLLARSE
jgi:hypothetical protein